MKLYRFTKYILPLLVLMTSFILSCKKDKVEPPVDMGYGYFPVNVGHYVIYQVDSTYYNDFIDSIEVWKYKVKETVESIYTDNSGRKTYRIERLQLNPNSTKWITKDIWAANLNSNNAEKVEENIRYVKLMFPIALDAEWDGNAFNQFSQTETQKYKYTDVHTPYSVNGLNFDSTVTVLQKEDATLISKDYGKEIYAKKVGLVYKKFQKLELDVSQHIISGSDYTYTILSYGN